MIVVWPETIDEVSAVFDVELVGRVTGTTTAAVVQRCRVDGVPVRLITGRRRLRVNGCLRISYRRGGNVQAAFVTGRRQRLLMLASWPHSTPGGGN